MTKYESQAGGVARTMEARSCERRKLATMAYVELGQENGGILLNIGEGGLAFQSALKLTSSEPFDMRFQLPNLRGWLAAKGRVAWISESRTEAGIQFAEVRDDVREQIRKWISGEGRATKTTRAYAEQRVLGAIQSEPIEPSRAEAPVENFVGSERAETVTAPVAESSPSSFRFNDYSMFGADSSAVNGWSGRKNESRGWLSFALLGICLAALFFVLGANVGRGKLEQWIGLAGKEQPAQDRQKRGEAPVADGGSNAPVEDGAQQDEKPKIPQDLQQGGRAPTQREQNGSETGGIGERARKDGARDETGPASTTKDLNSDVTSAVAALQENGSPSARKREASGQVTQRLEGGETNQNPAPAGRTILVNAPEPGSPPFFVNLTSQAVSASEWVAINEQHSVRIVPRTTQGSSGGPERVTIGKLISHSEPFYPAEARDKRLEGSVELRAMVGRTGEVIGVTQISGPPMLAAAATMALWEWRYEPTFIDGEPVETQAEVTVAFRLP